MGAVIEYFIHSLIGPENMDSHSFDAEFRAVSVNN
jgi:hypothetical protein